MRADGAVDEVFAAEAVIAAPRDQVWAALTDWSLVPDWMDGVEALRADGPVAPGTVLTFTSGGRDRDSAIVAAEPGRCLVIRSVLRGVTAEYAYELQDAADGTVVSLVATCTITGLRRMFGPVLHDAMRRTDSGQLEALRALLEPG